MDKSLIRWMTKPVDYQHKMTVRIKGHEYLVATVYH